MADGTAPNIVLSDDFRRMLDTYLPVFLRVMREVANNTALMNEARELNRRLDDFSARIAVVEERNAARKAETKIKEERQKEIESFKKRLSTYIDNKDTGKEQESNGEEKVKKAMSESKEKEADKKSIELNKTQPPVQKAEVEERALTSSNSVLGSVETRSQSKEIKNEREMGLSFPVNPPPTAPKNDPTPQHSTSGAKKLNKTADERTKIKKKAKLNMSSGAIGGSLENEVEEALPPPRPKRKPGRRSLIPFTVTPFGLPAVPIEVAEEVEDRRRGFWPKNPSEIGRSHPRRFDPTTKELICICGKVMNYVGLTDKELNVKFFPVREIGHLHNSCGQALNFTKDKLNKKKMTQAVLLENYGRDREEVIKEFGKHIVKLVEEFLKYNKDIKRREFDLDFFLATRDLGN